MAAAASNLIGQVLDGRYAVTAEIGRGGHGIVYRAVHLQLQRDVAIKVVTTPGEGLDRRFRREAQVQARLRHPAVVKLLDFGVDLAGRLYMVQEFVEGDSLTARLKRGRPPVDDAVLIVGDVLDALAEAHALGVVHRDVKPSNIMVVDGPRRLEGRLLDFGVAKLLDQAGHTRLTRAGALVGTPAYMSPEQVALEPLSPASDVYSVGVVLYEALAGQRPYIGSVNEVLGAHLNQTPPPLPEHVPPGLARVALTALARQPGDRFASAERMCEALWDAHRAGGVRRPRSSGELPRLPTRDGSAPPAVPRETRVLEVTPPPTPRVGATLFDAGGDPTAVVTTPRPAGRRPSIPPPSEATETLPPAPPRPGRSGARLAPVVGLALLLAALTAGVTLWVAGPAAPIDGSPPAELRIDPAAENAPLNTRPAVRTVELLPMPDGGAADVRVMEVVAVGAAPEPDAGPDATRAARPAPTDRRTRRARRAPPTVRPERRAPDPASPQPESTPEESPAPPPDAAAAPDAARPAVDPVDLLERRIDAAFAACRCDDVLAQLDRLARLDPASARQRRSRHRRECRLALPGNCVTRGARP